MTTADCLRALASAATPGPWRAVPHHWPEKAVPVISDEATFLAYATGGGDHERANADAALIATFSPERVLALADLVEAAEKTLDEPCVCEPDWTERGMHSPRCFWVAVRDYGLDAALARVEEAFRES